MVKEKHIKKLEKLSNALQIITSELDKLYAETNNFEYTSNYIMARNRLNVANDTIEIMYRNVRRENELR